MTARPGVPRAARADWEALGRPAATPPAPVDPAGLDRLPGPARRWLARAVPPGTPAWPAAELTMEGRIRLGGTWRRFTARQVVAPGRGFVWVARTRLFALPVTGFDRYGAAGGQMSWRLLGVVPVLSAAGPDVSRSAAGRLAGEAVTVPTACLRADWAAGPEPDTATMSWTLGGEREDCVLRVDPEGRLQELRMQRWGNPDSAPFGRHPFRVALSEEAAFSGVRVPTVLRAAWGPGSAPEDEFFRARIGAVSFR